MLKQYLSDRTKRLQNVTAGLVILIVAAIGTYLLVGSHAATPFVSITVANSSLTGSAQQVQNCSGAISGNCVLFGGTGTGPSNNMLVGIGAGGWGTVAQGVNANPDVASAVKYVRIDSTNSEAGADIGDFTNEGVKVDVSFPGNYAMQNGVYIPANQILNINASTWASAAVSWYQTNCTPAECLSVEVLNEPGGTWYWGPNALDPNNATAYANLVKATYNAFHAAYGSNAPRILATYDGAYGNQAYETFGQEWWNSSMSSFVGGIIVHPYGETAMDSSTPATTKASFAASAAGNRQLLGNAHSATGKPIDVTEVGWPTDSGLIPTANPSSQLTTVTTNNKTGDSFQWPEADSAGNAYPGLDQCNNVYNFIQYARSTNYVNAVIIYGFRNAADTGTSQYGLETHDNNNRKKDAWFALAAAGLNQPNPCPSAANNYT